MKIKLLIVQGRPEGKSMLFPRGEYVFGRGDECHVRPNSDWVSRQHCLLRVTADGAFLRDLGSRNGTLINGVRLIGERHLDDGDQVQVGPLVFAVVLEESGIDAAPPHEPLGAPHATTDTLVGALDTAEMHAFGQAEVPTPKERPAAPTDPSLAPVPAAKRKR